VDEEGPQEAADHHPQDCGQGRDRDPQFEDELPVEEGGDDEDDGEKGEDGKEPDAQDGGETAPDS
jgi:hypothetical protein